jgi:SAM-dependent methyltransferase
MPVDPWELYDRHAAEFAAATRLEELPDSFEALLASFVDAVSGPRVLDAGCGPGRDCRYFERRGLDPVGVDAAPGMLAYARTHSTGRYARMDVRALGFPDATFDGLWCPATVFFLPPAEMERALAEFGRVLRPDGVARIGFTLGDGRVESEKWGERTVEYHLPEARARSLLERSGFSVGSVSVNEVGSGRTFANFACRR